MGHQKNRINPATVILLGLLCAIIGYQARAERGGPQAAPSSIATVDLNRVMEGLEQWEESIQALNAMQTSNRAGEKEREDAINADLERLRAMQPGPDRRALEEKIAMAQLDYEALRAFNAEVLDTEAALRLHDFYRTVKTALGQMAAAEGYDAIYVDDSGGELRSDQGSGVSRQVQIRQQIINRRLLFVNDAIDITDELIERMNNAYNAGG